MRKSAKLESLAGSASPGGIVPLATGLMGWYPIYPLLGMNTCPTRK